MSGEADRQERRKQRTRLAIRTAALELFSQRGYRETTINAIADRADVAPRTVTVHFPTKEELLFDDGPFDLESLAERLAARRPHESALDTLRDWMATTMGTLDAGGPESNGRFWQQRALRAYIINQEPELRGRARAGYYQFERIIADAIGEDLDQSGNAMVPRLAALTAVAGLRELYESDEAQALSPSPKAADLLALVDVVISFTRGGIETSAVQTTPAAPMEAARVRFRGSQPSR